MCFNTLVSINTRTVHTAAVAAIGELNGSMQCSRFNGYLCDTCHMTQLDVPRLGLYQTAFCFRSAWTPRLMPFSSDLNHESRHTTAVAQQTANIAASWPTMQPALTLAFEALGAYISSFGFRFVLLDGSSWPVGRVRPASSAACIRQG